MTQQSKIYEDIVDHGSYVHDLSSCEIEAVKKHSGLNGIRTHNLSVPYQLSY